MLKYLSILRLQLWFNIFLSKQLIETKKYFFYLLQYHRLSFLFFQEITLKVLANFIQQH